MDLSLTKNNCSCIVRIHCNISKVSLIKYNCLCQCFVSNSKSCLCHSGKIDMAYSSCHQKSYCLCILSIFLCCNNIFTFFRCFFRIDHYICDTVRILIRSILVCFLIKSVFIGSIFICVFTCVFIRSTLIFGIFIRICTAFCCVFSSLIFIRIIRFILLCRIFIGCHCHTCTLHNHCSADEAYGNLFPS